MNDALRRAFVEESTETITKLNNELLRLEADSSDREAIDGIFRRAHTLKGNLGAMGFDEPAKIAHVMEDVLDAIRAGEIPVEADVIDALFAGLDALEATVAGIEQTGEPAALGDESVLDDLQATLDDPSPSEVDEADHVPSPVSSGDAFVHLTPGPMPGVDAMLVLRHLDAAVGDFETDPPPDQLEAGEYDDGFALSTDDLEQAIDAMSGLKPVATIDELAEPSSPPASDETPAVSRSTEVRSIRVDARQLDELHGLVETLVTARIAIDRGIGQGDLDAAKDGLTTVDKALAQLQDEVMSMRLVPLDTVFGTLPRLVRDLARETDKEIDFAMTGTDVELDRTIVNRLDDPLVHILRNAVDHGIEAPDDREAAGKDPTGHIEIRAERVRDTVHIEIEDDGGGIDPETIRSIATERGVKSAAELSTMPDEEVFDLIFEPGFSTASEVTDVSGRGVGMDAVTRTIRELEGTISVDSTPGHGTVVRLRLPVEIAIDDVLFVTVDGQHFGVPIRAVAEIARGDNLTRINGAPMVDHDDGLIPIVDLGEQLSTAASVPDGGQSMPDADSMIVRIRPEVRHVALACDHVTEQEEVVIRPLEGILRETPGLSGTTVLGDGNVVPILDVNTL